MAKAKTKDAPAVVVCAICFPGGAPAGASSVGCEHGTWVLDPNAVPVVPAAPVTDDERAGFQARITELEAALAAAKATPSAPQTPSSETPAE